MSKIYDLFDIQPMTDTKTCSKCKLDKPITDFSNASGGNYRRSECKTCANKLQKERKELKTISPEIPPNHICPICKKDESELKGRGGKNNPSFVLDHSHDTKKFRGYICHSCNRGLGIFQDTTILKNAIEYLNEKN
jgi:hypothetical protein